MNWSKFFIGELLMANYNVTITTGSGSQAMQRGTYSVEAVARGYDVSTLEPKTFTATDSEASETFTLTANGTLTINVNETGAAGGTPITAGSLIMTDETGANDYGSAVTIGADGNAVFNNVPYGDAGTPFTLYFRQIASDDTHNPYVGVITVEMTEQAQTQYVQNTAIAVQTFTLTDATYGMPIDGSLNFTANA